MYFNILFGNIPSHLWETVSDSVRIVRHALNGAGLETRVGTNQLDPDAINVFFDRFYEDPAFPLQLKAGGVRYGIVCTELLGLDGSWNYGAEGHVPDVVAAFELAVRHAEFVWCFHDYSVPACTALNPRTAYLPLGYVPEIDTLAATPWTSRDIVLLLCGMPSLRRDSISNQLSEQGFRMCYPGIPVPLMIRDSLMERARINLSVQKTDRHDVVSVTRICHSITNRVPLLLETVDLENPFTKYCLIAEPGRVAETAARHLRETDLEAWAKARYDQFREEMPMTAIMERVLAATPVV